MATELQYSDSMPCHNQQVNSTSTPSAELLHPGDQTTDLTGGNDPSFAKLTLFTGHTHSSLQADQDLQACGGLNFNSESKGGSGSYDAPASDSVLANGELCQQIGGQLKLLPMNDQIRELQTIIRDKSASRGDFMFSADRLIRLVVEEGLNQLPYKECIVTTPTGYKYEGVKFEKGNCGVSIMRSGEAMEQGLRDCCRSIRIGKILIQSDEETQRAKVYYAKFPPDIYRRKVLLMYPILRAKSIIQEFPEITILTTEVHPVAPTHFGQKYFGTD
ncbi:uracil phosphoribosyltransferase homolog isoform X2 [Erinaceus europaeus]|uniref:Uracil phosphoribosyltransferase homolog isoform X2 n=1 Tax=Erinaceus europaeus TaxID=9365 RepID=A0ABM3WRF2_ERIEU|nr:uracil phosphoribosyltransferase homolog isoform X2 [Erinaceus europaeus]